MKWKWVSESMADFLAAVEPQPLWTGSLPVCLVEYHQGLSRRLRLVLTSQTHLTKGELSLLDEQHPAHGKYMTVACYLAMQLTDAQSQIGMSCRMGTSQMPGNCCMRPARGVTASVWAVVHAMPLGRLAMLPTKPRIINLSRSTRSISMMRGGGNYAFPLGQVCCKMAATGNTPQSVLIAPHAHKTHRKVLPTQKLASLRPAQQRVRRFHRRVKYRSLPAKARQWNPRPPLS